MDYLPHKTTMTRLYYSELLKTTSGSRGEMEGNADPMSTATV